MRTPGQAVPGWKPPEKISLGSNASLLALATTLSPLCTAGDVKQQSKEAAERALP